MGKRHDGHEAGSRHTSIPDANSTLRLTYGRVLPYKPADGVEYGYYTT